MNRQTIVQRALCVLAPLLAFALIYGLPMLTLKTAVEHGWYVAADTQSLPEVGNRSSGAEIDR